ncbi:ImmA/IrrE family metallo-endopeptidase [Candidatus Parcubacteria bacterium]|nr:ImmA/IrrE family metallo-endopeptidase [Candidatus Parcubacteria bacterium]
MSSSNKIEFKINPSRLNYLLDLYKLSKKDFLSLLNQKIKRNIVSLKKLNRILNQEELVGEMLLKRIDKIFEKGITWYVTTRNIADVKKSSIFFRKDTFNSEIKFESIKVVHKYEELSADIQNLGNYINFLPIKKIKKYKTSDDSIVAASEVYEIVSSIENDLIKKNIINKTKLSDDRSYLKNLIRILEQLDIFVFEHIEMPRKKERVNFNGFFICPNTIVIKKQGYVRREIFTLLHEFAHYILEQEEIDDLTEERINHKKNKIEQWCNTFSFFFLLNNKKSDFEKLSQASRKNDFHRKKINDLYNDTFLSYSAFYTRLLIDKKIMRRDYDKIMYEISKAMKKAREDKRNKFKIENEKRIAMGKNPAFPVFKPIESYLFKELVKINYFEGNINENSLREYLKIKPEKNIQDVIY